MTQKQFYKTQAWRRARDAFIETRKALDGGMCQNCGQDLGYIVHHEVWLNDDNVNDYSISLNPRLFRYVCLDCHNKIKNPDEIPLGRVRYDEYGNVLPADTAPIKP